MLSKEQFILEVWSRINSTNCEALDAVMEIAERHQIDMESAGKLVNSNPALKQLVASQAHSLNQLKKPAASLE